MLSLWLCANEFQLYNYLCITLYLQNVIYKLHTQFKMSQAEVVIKSVGYYKSSNYNVYHESEDYKAHSAKTPTN